MERVLAGWSGTGDVSMSLATDDNIHAPSGRRGASRLPGTWLTLQETTCWDRRVQWEPSCLAMLCKQMPPPTHASLHPPVPTAPALLGANTSAAEYRCQQNKTHTHTHGNQTPSSCLKMPLAGVSASYPRGSWLQAWLGMVTFANKH